MAAASICADARDEERIGRWVLLIARRGGGGGVKEGDPGGRGEEGVGGGGVVREVIPVLAVPVGGWQRGVRARGVLEEVLAGEDQHEGAYGRGAGEESGDGEDGE